MKSHFVPLFTIMCSSSHNSLDRVNEHTWVNSDTEEHLLLIIKQSWDKTYIFNVTWNVYQIYLYIYLYIDSFTMEKTERRSNVKWRTSWWWSSCCFISGSCKGIENEWNSWWLFLRYSPLLLLSDYRVQTQREDH